MTEPNPDSFVRCPAGHVEYGLIEQVHAAAIGVKAAPILLQNGYRGNNGYGYLHLTEKWERVRQLKGLGFKDVETYCSAVAQNYTRMCQGDSGRLILVWPHKGFDLQLVVELKTSQEPFWTIVTGIPKRVERSKVLLQVARTGGREPSPSDTKRPRFATLSLPKKV